MPYEDEDPPYAEPDPVMDALTWAVIGAAMEVHRRLGPGLDEGLYEGALCIELTARKIPFARQVVISVGYKGQIIGDKRLDLIIDGCLIVELKAVEQIAPVHKAQLLTYLKITGLKLGLLLNFNVPALKDGVTRVIRS
ncbi:MAG TPA: GxxExxY protein [Tepidisphaeraceae bacterium]|nr:GxxExxY protein [Tepidisphaeraceae bacterium]